MGGFGPGRLRSVRPSTAASDPHADPHSDADPGAVAHTDPDALCAAQADGDRDDFQRAAISVEGRDVSGGYGGPRP